MSKDTSCCIITDTLHVNHNTFYTHTHTHTHAHAHTHTHTHTEAHFKESFTDSVVHQFEQSLTESMDPEVNMPNILWRTPMMIVTVMMIVMVSMMITCRTYVCTHTYVHVVKCNFRLTLYFLKDSR